MDHVNEKCGRRMVVGAHSPSFESEKKNEENRELVRMINESGANVVLVGVGAPKQEKWIMRWKDEMPGVKVWMALGATIEFEAGSVKRAPKFFQKFALEWLYRIYCEPKRMLRPMPFPPSHLGNSSGLDCARFGVGSSVISATTWFSSGISSGR